MLVGEKQITFEEYMKLPIGAPYQLIHGCLIDWPSRTVPHQLALNEVTAAFCNYGDREENNGFFCMGPIEVILDDQNSFQPDFIYIAEERKDIIKDYIYGAPDIVVEILWEKNAYYDLRPKKDIYEKYGVKELIIVDPIAKDVDLYALIEGVYYLHQRAKDSDLLRSLILTGFSIDLAKLFRRIERFF